MKFTPIIALALAAAAVSSCRNDEPSDVAYNRDAVFAEVFDTPAFSHTWNLATRAVINVQADHVIGRVEVFTEYHGRLFRLADLRPSSESVAVHFDVVSDMNEFTVLVDGLAYSARSGADIMASGYGSRPEWADKAEPLGWIMAMEVDGDWDFNDIIARFVPESDGGVTITALAAGIGGACWMHYTNGTTDYILTPAVEVGYIDTSWVDEWVAPNYVWHSWFANEGESSVALSWTVNTLGPGGANDKTGASLTIPAEMMGGAKFFPSYLCLSDYINDELVVSSGFYVTQGMWDIKRPLEDEEAVQDVYAVLPPGKAPMAIVIPDLCLADREGNVKLWEWPTETSRIDLVYPRFIGWITDPSLLWSLEEPEGWSNHPAVVDDKGNFQYYGYYTRTSQTAQAP